MVWGSSCPRGTSGHLRRAGGGRGVMSAEYAKTETGPGSSAGPRWPGRCGNDGSTCCRPASMTPLFPDSCRIWSRSTCAAAAVRHHDRAKLAGLAIAAPALATTRDPARAAEVARPAGAVRLCEADLRQLGVHVAISVLGCPRSRRSTCREMWMPPSTGSGRRWRPRRTGRVRAASRRVLGRQDPVRCACSWRWQCSGTWFYLVLLGLSLYLLRGGEGV